MLFLAKSLGETFTVFKLPESVGAECNHFVVGLFERLKPVEAWLEEGQDHAEIIERLVLN